MLDLFGSKAEKEKAILKQDYQRAIDRIKNLDEHIATLTEALEKAKDKETALLEQIQSIEEANKRNSNDLTNEIVGLKKENEYLRNVTDGFKQQIRHTTEELLLMRSATDKCVTKFVEKDFECRQFAAMIDAMNNDLERCEDVLENLKHIRFKSVSERLFELKEERTEQEVAKAFSEAAQNFVHEIRSDL